MKLKLVLAALLLAACGKKTATQQQLDAQFEKDMTGAVLVGSSTRTNKEGVFGPERYFIDKVSRISGNTWLFTSRMKVSEKEVPLPIPVNIEWAGDTPVITMTDFSMPGVGTYTARVLLYRGQYAGTWSGQKGGGQMFGKIERQ